MTRKMKNYGMTDASYAIGVKAEDVCSNLARIRGVLEKELGKDVGITNTLRSCKVRELRHQYNTSTTCWTQSFQEGE